MNLITKADDARFTDIWDGDPIWRDSLHAVIAERDAALQVALMKCPVCGSETAGSNESVINKELFRVRADLAAALEERDVLKGALTAERKISYACRNDASRNGDECATWKHAALENSASARKLRADLTATLAQLAEKEKLVCRMAWSIEELHEKTGCLCDADEPCIHRAALSSSSPIKENPDASKD